MSVEGAIFFALSFYVDCEYQEDTSLMVSRYEGTYEVNALVAGRGVTGIAAIKAPSQTKQNLASSEGQQ